MSILFNNVILSLEQAPEEAVSAALKAAGLSPDAVLSAYIAKRSVDARHQDRIKLVYSVGVDLADPTAEKKLAEKLHAVYRAPALEFVPTGTRPMAHRPVIAGFGPAGMFAGLLLAEHGYRPIVLERGESVERRTEAVERFWREGTLDVNCNVQFGEGGAGTFSDGKLTTRINDPRCSLILQRLCDAGAGEAILQEAKPHVGTDVLRQVVKNLRLSIEKLGGEVRFSTTLAGLVIKNGRVTACRTSAGEIPCETVVLALGHSARDTVENLFAQGMPMERKPFSAGVRAEHLQENIDRALYGKFAGHPHLPVGEYQLSAHFGGLGVYTFCMCPGGLVVASSSEAGGVVTNGMSYHARDGRNANAAVAVSVRPEDLPGAHPLEGIRFQRELERAAFLAGGQTYAAPAQRLGDFRTGKLTEKWGTVTPTYRPEPVPARLDTLLPPFIADTLQKGFAQFGRQIRGYDNADCLLTGVETRTSSPVRMPRGEDFQSSLAEGVYPAGEGAGYAGGIMSAAADGMRVAEQIMSVFTPPVGD